MSPSAGPRRLRWIAKLKVNWRSAERNHCVLSGTQSTITSLSKTIAKFFAWLILGNLGIHTANGFDVLPAWVAGIADAVVAESDDNCYAAAAQYDSVTDRLTVLMRMSKQLVIRIICMSSPYDCTDMCVDATIGTDAIKVMMCACAVS